MTTNTKRPHSVYPCRYGCGKVTTHKGTRCLECYKRDMVKNKVVSKKRPPDNPAKHSHHKKYPCRNNCGGTTVKHGSLCLSCYNKVLYAKAERQQAEINRQKEERLKVQAKLHKPAKLQICPKSPDKRHFEIINSDKIGVCKYCGRKKDYNKLQDKYLDSLRL